MLNATLKEKTGVFSFRVFMVGMKFFKRKKRRIKTLRLCYLAALRETLKGKTDVLPINFIFLLIGFTITIATVNLILIITVFATNPNFAAII